LKTACIVLNYKGWESALRLANSLHEMDFTDKEVFVVENGSPDKSREMLQDALGESRIVYTQQNLGYAGGMNLGLKHALQHTDAEFFWILTKDLTVEKNCLTILHDLWPRLENPGFLGSLTDLNATDKVYFYQAHIEADGRTRHGTKGRSIGEIPELKDEYGPTDYVNGACVFTSRKVLETVGLIPEDYFLYFEDCEWGLRASRAGFKNYVSYRSRVHHHREVGAFNPVAEYYCRRNAYLFKKRNGFLTSWTKTAELLRLQKHALKSWLKGDRKMLEILRAVRRDIANEKSGVGPWR
jgi:GT2 family glycosyltransferase